MDCKALLRGFMGTFGVSGYEKGIAHCFRDTMIPFADNVSIDRIGNVIARIDGSDPASPAIMAFAHLDQLGFIVRKIEKDGFIQIDRLGGVPEKVLPGLNIRILTGREDFVDGVIGSKSHHAAAPEEKYKADAVTSLFIDIGARSAGEVRARGVDVGSPAAYLPFSQELGDHFVSGTSVDNRGGLVGLAVAAERLKAKRPKSTIYLVGTVWEEFNLRGAMLAARSCKPAIVISLDVVLAGDTRDLAGRYDVACGDGPAIVLYSFHGRGTLNGTLPHKGLVDLAERTGSRDGIPLQRFASLGILTDASYAQLEGEGMAALELGFPARYTHTPVETADIRDIERLGLLLAGMAGRIDRDFPLDRY